jgi:hypothetical protein
MAIVANDEWAGGSPYHKLLRGAHRRLSMVVDAAFFHIPAKLQVVFVLRVK